ncbi:hypothetical protein BG015_000717 [Linnemannia schmuckeri]|uniref:Uncharacterized protein n=1 Tax=Linnemannia schmuckeri TaxID=64567 RepID=A0A9P5RT54_9FUNG|nr:hypothetical protein BG015_000717 [Linnemannia schmuckeri]
MQKVGVPGLVHEELEVLKLQQPSPCSGFWRILMAISIPGRCPEMSGGARKCFEGFLQCFPLLVEYHDDICYPAVADQFINHCPLLEVIRIRQESNSYSRSAPRRLGVLILDSISLLSSLSRLRVLDLPRETIKAENILKNPWVYLDLEEICCQAVEVPFLTKEEERQIQEICQREAGAIDSDQQHRTDEEDELMELSQKYVSTRTHIMTQLSKLTSLKHLSLSPDLRIGDELFEYRFGATRFYKSERDGRVYIQYDDVLPDTLYLRLETGLGQLSCLRKLECLGLESMDHRMETVEVQWMAKRFPRLRDMRVLVTENHVGMEPDPKNDALVALMHRLRPDVVQRQSFDGILVICVIFE